MNWILYVLSVLLVLALTLFFTGWWRYVLTGYLITRVGPYEQPGGGAGQILVIGDSTGYGTGANRTVDSVAGRLGSVYTWYRIQNNSVNGRTVSGAQKVADQLPADKQYSLIILQIGANDLLAGRSAHDVVKSMQQLIEAVRPATDWVVVLTAGNIGGVPIFTGVEAQRYEAVSREYTERMIMLAQQYQDVSFVPLFDEPANDPFVAHPNIYTAVDGLHPTSAGYAIWYQKAEPYFELVLDSR